MARSKKATPPHLRAVVGVDPLIVDAHEGAVVAAAAPGEVQPGVVGVHGVVLRPIEDRVAAREHGADAQHLRARKSRVAVEDARGG